MNGRCLAPLLAVLAVVLLVPAGVTGQTQPAAADSWAPSRTPWGEPDLQGVWDYRTITPLQRSPELAGQEFFTEEEAAEFEKLNTGSTLPAWSWWEDKLELTDDRRTSLIVDPPDGRMPSLTPEAQERIAAMAAVFRRPPQRLLRHFSRVTNRFELTPCQTVLPKQIPRFWTAILRFR